MSSLLQENEPVIPEEHDIVLAAALKSQAQIIVTFNTKDFPDNVLQKYQIEAQHPDVFLRHQMDLHLPAFLSCVKSVRARLKNPPKDANEYLFTLFSQLPQTVNILKPYANLI